MFKKVPARCDWSLKHDPHGGMVGFFDWGVCDGSDRSKAPWPHAALISPNQRRKLLGYPPEKHKHFLEVSVITHLTANYYDTSDYIGWKCRSCNHTVAIGRTIFKRMVTEPGSIQLTDEYRGPTWQ